MLFSKEYPTGFIFSLTLLPLLVRIFVIFSGATGYLFHGTYKILLLLIPVLWRHKKQQIRGWRIFWPVEEPLPSSRTWAAAVGIALILSLLGIATTTLAAQWLNLDPFVIQAQLNSRFDVTAIGAIVITILLATFNAGLEELHYRWWLDRELSKAWNEKAGTIISAVAFAGMHLLVLAGTGVLSLLAMSILFGALFVAGVTWSLLSRRPGGIHAAWLSHGLTNVILMSWGLHWLGYV